MCEKDYFTLRKNINTFSCQKLHLSSDLNSNHLINSNEFIETNARFDEEHGHIEILKRFDFPEDHHIDARLLSNESLLTRHTDFTPSSISGISLPDIVQTDEKTYPMMIKIIQGSIQGVSRWKELCQFMSHDQVKKPKFPTMASILANAFQEDNTELDCNQRITYETICGTFLLRLINDGIDNSTTLGAYFAQLLSELGKDISSSDNNLQ